MPRKSEFDAARLDHILKEQHRVISRTQVLACGMSPRALHHRIAASGPWQRLLPGVYLTVTGMVTQDQREMAALLYAGRTSLITGPAAVRRHRLRSAGPDVVDVLIPWHRRRQSVAFVRVHRTRKLPKRMFVTGKIRFAEVPRAVADAARMLTRFDDVRAVVCEAVQRKSCTVAEADFRVLILRSGLPKPVFNAQLFDEDGTFIAMVDAWWQDAGVAGEVDSRAYHLSAEDQDRTTRRHDELLARGILLLHFPPKRVRTDAAGIVSEIRRAIEKGLQRPPLPVKGLPPAAGHWQSAESGRTGQEDASSADRASGRVGERNS